MKLNRIMGLTPSKESEPIATGFKLLDSITGGLRIGEICTIAGRPGMGVTAFCISLLRNIGVLQKVPTAYLSLAHTESVIAKRLKTDLTGRWGYDEEIVSPPREVINVFEEIGFHLRDVRDNDQAAIELMKAAPVWIEHDLGVTMNEIISRMERLHQENHVRLFFIDSLQEILLGSKFVDQSQEILKLRHAASRLNVSVVLTTSLNRSVETRGGSKRPMLSDLKDWGHLETYSSLVILIYRPEYYKIEIFEDCSPATGMADIMIEKNCNGHCGNDRMHFDKCCISFWDDNDEKFVDAVSYVKPMLFDENELSSSEVESDFPF